MAGHAIYTQRHVRNNDFPIDFAILQKRYGPPDRRTDRQTDTLSYRDAIAASKKELF